jgi:hypothetical protein
MQEVEIRISKKGQVKIETRGFVGTACKAATASLESALGGEVTEDTPTPEMNQVESTTIKSNA